MNILVFDIETIPDTQAGRRLYGLEGLSDAEVASALFTLRQQETQGSNFLKHPYHQIVAISVVLSRHDQFEVWSLGETDASEAELIQRFFQGIEKYTPTLVSWNGSGFDLPVLHYRAMRHKIQAQRYFETGDTDQQFRWNNYLNRFHERHIDLMDCLAGYQNRAFVPLDHMATLLNLPGKFSMSGHEVWAHYQTGNLEKIRQYCETDVLNTYLIYLRYQFLRGHLSEQQLREANLRVRTFLADSEHAHCQAFLALWTDTEG